MALQGLQKRVGIGGLFYWGMEDLQRVLQVLIGFG